MANEDWSDWTDKPLSRKDLEIPSPAWYIDRHQPAAIPDPYDFYGGLMSEAPGHDVEEDPTPDPEDRSEYAVYGLTGDEMTVLDATVMAGLSVRQAANELPWSATTVWRLHTSAMKRITNWWEDNREILEALEALKETDEQDA